MAAAENHRRSRNSIDLRRLEQFVAVVEHGSLTEAATDLQVTQQALSVAIRTLEEQMGVTLFERTRGMRPSAAGLRLYESARVLLAGASRMIPDVRAVADGQPEEIRVGYTPAIRSVDVFDAIGHRLRPCTSFRAERLFPKELRSRLIAGDIDIAFRRGVTPPAGLAGAVIGFNRLCVAVRSDAWSTFDHADVGLRDFSGLPLIVWAQEPTSAYTSFLLSQCRRVGFEPAMVVSRFQGLDQVAAPLAVPDGFALVSSEPGRYFGGRVTVVPVREQLMTPIQALWLPTTGTGVARELVEWMSNEARSPFLSGADLRDVFDRKDVTGSA